MQCRSKPSLAAFIGCMMPAMLGFCFLCPSMDCLWHKYHYCPRCGEKVSKSLNPFVLTFDFFTFRCSCAFNNLITNTIWSTANYFCFIFVNTGCWLWEIRSLCCDGSSALGWEEFCTNQLKLIRWWLVCLMSSLLSPFSTVCPI